MRNSLHRIRMRPTTDDQDQFFLWAIVILPLVSLCAYVFDAYYYFVHARQGENGALYEGLLSTIVMVFAYLQYCVPIQSKLRRCIYYVVLWALNQAGHVGYFLACFHKGNLFTAVLFIGWMILDTIHTSALLYCRVRYDLNRHIEVKIKNIFHFFSRVEFLLVVLIPIYFSEEYSTVTRHNIAFFLLFDFFSEAYERFRSPWIKSCLFLFVTFVTTSVATEWLYVLLKNHKLEQTMEVAELIAGCLCYTLIIMQFFPRHFKQDSSRGSIATHASRDSVADISVISL